MDAIGIPFAGYAEALIARLADATGSAAIRKLDGTTILGERAALAGFRVPGRISAGGGCRLLDAVGGTIALNLARPSDRELLPALFEDDSLDPDDEKAIASMVGGYDVEALLIRGRELGLAIAGEHELTSSPTRPVSRLVEGAKAGSRPRSMPRVLDLSALWAGPLAGHLLWLAGAEVIKVESRTRPDAMRDGEPDFFATLNQGKASVVLDFADAADRQALLGLIASCDIVIEAARPRALIQLGIDAAALVQSRPGLVWLTITGHGAEGVAAQWVGFGDDCGVAGGLSAALRQASGRTGFVGDAIADPLSGLHAALAAWQAWSEGAGGRFGISMRNAAAQCLVETQGSAPATLTAALIAWRAVEGSPFPPVRRKPTDRVSPLGSDTGAWLERLDAC